MTDATSGDSLLTSHYTVRCHSLNGRVAKLSIQDLLRKIKSA